MAEKQTKTVTKKPQKAMCKLDGEAYELIAITHGTATISKDGNTYFVSAAAVEPTNKTAKDIIADA